MVRHNRPLVVLCASTLLFLSGMFSLQTVGVYYARDVLDNADLYIVLTVVQTVGMIVAAVIVPKVVEALGKRRAYIVAGVIAAVAGVGVAVAPGLSAGDRHRVLRRARARARRYQHADLRPAARHRGLRGVEERHPRRRRQLRLLSFTRKAGQGIGGALAAYTIGLGGYVSGAPSQTDAAVTSIRVAAGAVPAAVILAPRPVMLAYPLTEQAFREMVAEMAQRRAGEAWQPTRQARCRTSGANSDRRAEAGGRFPDGGLNRGGVPSRLSRRKAGPGGL